MNLHYMEASFSIPTSEGDRNELHKVAANIIYSACNFEKREFIYTIRTLETNSSISESSTNKIVSVRALELSNTLRPWSKTLSLKEGDNSSFVVQVPCYQRIRGRERYIEESSWNDWFSGYIQKKGFSNVLIKMRERKNERVLMHRLKGSAVGYHSYIIPTAVFYFSASISDESKVGQAWINGVGRSKGFGFGMIEQIK